MKRTTADTMTDLTPEEADCSSQTHSDRQSVEGLRVVSMAVIPSRRQPPLVRVVLGDSRSADLHPDVIVACQVRTGMVLGGEEDWNHLLTEQALLEARVRLTGVLSRRRKSVREAKAYLTRLKFAPAVVEQVVEQALERGALDDEAYALAFVRTQDRVAREGPRQMQAGLFRRGVDSEIIEQAVEPFESEESQLPKARELALRRWPGILRSAQLKRDHGNGSGGDGERSKWTRRLKSSPDDPTALARQKLGEFLLRRGFTPDVVRGIVREVTSGSVQIDED